MTRVQQTATTMLFVGVLILGGWAWSQDDPVASPSDLQAGNVPPVSEPAAAPAPPVDAMNAPAAGNSSGPGEAGALVDAASQSPTTAPRRATLAAPRTDIVTSLTIFVMAVWLGIEVISKVPPTLHTPLMSGSNAISGIALVGAVIVAAAVVDGISPTAGIFARFLGFIAVTLAMINAVGGFMVTHRMLAMFAANNQLAHTTGSAPPGCMIQQLSNTTN